MGYGSSVKAVILAAGYATRLYPLTLNIPKPLLQVTYKKAVIDFIVDDLSDSHLPDEIVVVTNHKFFPQFSDWAKKRRDSRISVLDDGTRSNQDRLGAVGDIYYAVKNKAINSDLIVIGGDNLFELGFGKFLKFAQFKRPFASLGLFDIKCRQEASRFGVVKTDSQGKVVSFEEKPAKPKSTHVATCLYYLPKRTLKLLDRYIADPKTSKDAPGNYIRWLMEHDTVFGFALEDGNWHDIGHFDSYKEVVKRFNR